MAQTEAMLIGYGRSKLAKRLADAAKATTTAELAAWVGMMRATRVRD